MISIGCLIYRSVKYADAVWNSVHEFTPRIGHDTRFFFVANDATTEVLEHLKSKGYPFYEHINPEYSLDGYAPPLYMRGVYMGWNRAVMESDDTAVLISSDFMFSPGWMDALLSELRPDTIVASKIVERRHPVHGMNPRAYEKDCGSHPDNFRKHEFLEYVSQVRRRDTEPGGMYGPLAFHKSKALEAGMFPEGNPVSTYGDQEFIARLSRIGVRHITSLDSVVYHFKEGEMSE